MIPKLTNSFYALNNGVKSVKIAGQSLDEIDIKSTIITNEATTTNCTMILIFEGIIFRINEMTTLPTPITKRTEIDITIDAFNSAVIAKAEHIPNT